MEVKEADMTKLTPKMRLKILLGVLALAAIIWTLLPIYSNC
jgi:hypothetical protein